MSIKAQLAKAKKKTALLLELKNMALNEGRINYALSIEKRIVTSKNNVNLLTSELEEKRKKDSWFAFLAK
jgi:hypothetical protein